MKNIIEQILDENNKEILEIVGKDGQIIKLEQVALIVVEGEYYTILHPLADDVLPDDVLVFRIDDPTADAQLILEEDEDKIAEVFSNYYDLYNEKD